LLKLMFVFAFGFVVTGPGAGCPTCSTIVMLGAACGGAAAGGAADGGVTVGGVGATGAKGHSVWTRVSSFQERATLWDRSNIFDGTSHIASMIFWIIGCPLPRLVLCLFDSTFMYSTHTCLSPWTARSVQRMWGALRLAPHFGFQYGVPVRRDPH
jgi:hypothetical protein